MRLPRIERDSWEVRSAEEPHRDNPDGFWIPSEQQRASLQRGHAAQLMVDVAFERDGQRVVQGERMWVIVAERFDDIYIGVLDGKPDFAEAEALGLRLGAEIPFQARDVLDIGHPPADYVDWHLAQPRPLVWPRAGV